LGKTFFRFVTIHAFDRWTDEQIDSFLLANMCLHCCSAWKITSFHSKLFLHHQSIIIVLWYHCLCT